MRNVYCNWDRIVAHWSCHSDDTKFRVILLRNSLKEFFHSRIKTWHFLWIEFGKLFQNNSLFFVIMKQSNELQSNVGASNVTDKHIVICMGRSCLLFGARLVHKKGNDCERSHNSSNLDQRFIVHIYN